MAPLYAFIITCSDGQPLHGPPAKKFDQKPDENGHVDYFVELPFGHPKHMSWLEKLGASLAILEGSNVTRQPDQYVLGSFPEHYRLYEHVTYEQGKDSSAVSTHQHTLRATHRHDVYLYGHPKDTTARFRSPNEFSDHAHWLSSNPAQNPSNCTCKLCPNKSGSAAPTKTARVKSDEGRERSTSRLTSSAPVPARQSSAGESPRGSQGAGRPNSVPHQQRTDAVMVTNPPATVLSTVSASASTSAAPMPLPEFKYLDQYHDSRYDGFFFRVGELVWFRRAGQSYALGIVLHRFEAAGQHQYDMSPLSHPYDKLATVRCVSEDMVPWLAWPPPPYFNKSLNTLPSPPQYQDFDWKGLKDGKYGDGSPEVDASIMAANMINCTWTPLGFIEHTKTDLGTAKSYEAIFSGAEKIWLGDAVRLESAHGTEVLIVHQILEEAQPSSVTATLVGSVYRLDEGPKQGSKQNSENLQNLSLPERLRVDTEKCNVQSMRAKGETRFWKLLENQRKVGLGQIKGRWHEASLLLPRLMNDPTKNHLVDGIGEISLVMRSRTDPTLWRGTAIPTSLYRAETRRAATRNSMGAADDLPSGLGPLLSQSGDPVPSLEAMDDIGQYWNFEDEGQASH